MGIKGLTTFCNKFFTSIADRTNLSNKLLVVDGFAFLYHFSEKTNDYYEYESKIDEFLDFMINKSKVKMVFIFDSPIDRNSLKFKTKIDRIKKVTQNVNKIPINTKGMLPLLAERIALSTICKYNNIEILKCQGDEESDKEIFMYAFKNQAIGILSNDSDFCAYFLRNNALLPTPKLIPMWTLAFCLDEEKAFAYAIDQKKLIRALQLNDISELSFLAALVGNDYTDDVLTNTITDRLRQQFIKKKDIRIGTKAYKKNSGNNSQKHILIARKVIEYTRSISLFEKNTNSDEHIQNILKWIFGSKTSGSNKKKSNLIYAQTLNQINTSLEQYTCNLISIENFHLKEYKLNIGYFCEDLFCRMSGKKRDKKEEVIYFVPAQLAYLNNILGTRYMNIRLRCLSLLARFYSDTFDIVHIKITADGDLVENVIYPSKNVLEGKSCTLFLKYLYWILDMDHELVITTDHNTYDEKSNYVTYMNSKEKAYDDWKRLFVLCNEVNNFSNTLYYEIRKVTWTAFLHLVHENVSAQSIDSITHATIALYHVSMAVDTVTYFLQNCYGPFKHINVSDDANEWNNFAWKLREIKENNTSCLKNDLTKIFI